MRGLAALLLALTVAACHQTTAPVESDPSRGLAAASGTLTTDRESYPAGATATLRLANQNQHALGYNLCTSTLERRAGGEWRTAEGEDQRVCTMELRILEAGGTATYSYLLAATLPEGEYRFRTSLEHMGNGTRETATSNTFRVTR